MDVCRVRPRHAKVSRMKKKQTTYDSALRVALRQPKNLAQAYKLLQCAAQEGDARAIYALGTWHFHGHYLPRNLKKGIHLIRQAADAGISDALYDLAVSYEKGVGVSRSEKRAAEYYLKAALAGDMNAWHEIGRCFYYGLGVTQNRRVSNVFLAHFERQKRELKVKKSGDMIRQKSRIALNAN